MEGWQNIRLRRRVHVPRTPAYAHAKQVRYNAAFETAEVAPEITASVGSQQGMLDDREKYAGVAEIGDLPGSYAFEALLPLSHT